jgi:hypothetical protein
MGGAKLRTGKSLREAGGRVDRRGVYIECRGYVQFMCDLGGSIPKHEDAGAKRDSPFTAETQRTQRKRRKEQRERKDRDPAFAAEGAEIADGKTGREVLCPL